MHREVIRRLDINRDGCEDWGHMPFQAEHVMLKDAQDLA